MKDRGETHREDALRGGTQGRACVPEGTHRLRDETKAVTGWELGTVGHQRMEAGGTKGTIMVNGGQASESVNKAGGPKDCPDGAQGVWGVEEVWERAPPPWPRLPSAVTHLG